MENTKDLIDNLINTSIEDGYDYEQIEEMLRTVRIKITHKILRKYIYDCGKAQNIVKSVDKYNEFKTIFSKFYVYDYELTKYEKYICIKLEVNEYSYTMEYYSIKKTPPNNAYEYKSLNYNKLFEYENGKITKDDRYMLREEFGFQYLEEKEIWKVLKSIKSFPGF